MTDELTIEVSAEAAAYEITRCTLGRSMGWKPIGEAPEWVRRRLLEVRDNMAAGQPPQFFSDPRHDEFFWALVRLGCGDYPGSPGQAAEIVRQFARLTQRADPGQPKGRIARWWWWFRSLFRRTREGIFK